MNLEQLKYIVEVAKSGSLTKAAQKLHITLSAISQSISLLEKELGVPLFNRSRGLNTMPTEEGKVVIERAIDILKKVNELKEEVDTYKDTLAGELTITTIPGRMHLLVNTVAQFRKDFPSVAIKISEQGPKEIIDSILSNKSDIGLMVLEEEYIPKHSDLVYETVLQGKMVVAVHPESKLAKEKFITPELLLKETLVLYDDDIIRQFIDVNITKYGNMDILFVTNNTIAIHNAVRKGLAVTIGLDFSFQEMANSNMMIIDLKTPENKPIPYGWVRYKNQPSSRIAKTFLQRLTFDI